MTTKDEYVMARVDHKCQRRTPGCFNEASKTELVLDTLFLQKMEKDVDYADSWCATCANCEVGTE